MCGRYVTPDEAALEREYHVGRDRATHRLVRNLEAYSQSFNVAPTQDVPVIRVVRDVRGQREVVAMRWGLVPFWAKGEAPKYATFNATIEKLETAPAWRGPWKRGQRCIMPAAGFYEWHVLPDGGKVPYFVRPSADDTTFAIAALWDESIAADGRSILSSTIITMPANELMANIHNTKTRMPAILRHEDIESWLTGTPEQAKSVLKQFPADEMIAWPVSKRVNAARNQGPELIEEVEY